MSTGGLNQRDVSPCKEQKVCWEYTSKNLYMVRQAIKNEFLEMKSLIFLCIEPLPKLPCAVYFTLTFLSFCDSLQGDQVDSNHPLTSKQKLQLQYLKLSVMERVKGQISLEWLHESCFLIADGKVTQHFYTRFSIRFVKAACNVKTLGISIMLTGPPF